MTRVNLKNFAVDAAGSVSSGAQVEVRDADGVLATLYAAATGATEAYAGENPFLAGDGTPDKVGVFDFWVEEGFYTITVGSGASANSFPIEALSAERLTKMNYPTRAALVAAHVDGDTPDGTIKSDGTVQYVASAGAAVTGLPAGLLPYGIAESKHFGAACDGVTNDTTAINNMLTYFNTGIKRVRFSRGTSLYDGGGKVLASGKIDGYGRDVSKVKFTVGGETLLENRPVDATPLDSLEVCDFEIEGDWGGLDHTDTLLQNENETLKGGKPIVIYNTQYVNIHHMKMSYFRSFGVVVRNHLVLNYTDNIVFNGVREAINAQGGNRVTVSRNYVKNVDDDAFNVSVSNESGGGDGDSGNPTDFKLIVTDNEVFGSAGIKCSSASNTVISGNVLRCTRDDGIAFADDSPFNNSAPSFNVVISNNVVSDVIDRTDIDGLTTNSQYIRLSSAVPTQGLAGAIPGESDGTDVEPIYDYLGVNEDGVTRSPHFKAVIEGNILGRTLPNATNFSNYGFGQFWTKNGFLDPAMTDDELQSSSSEAIVVTESTRNLLISDNVIGGVFKCVRISDPASPNRNLKISNNIFTDFTFSAIDCNQAAYIEIEISNNLFDGDPFHVRSTRNANGTWASQTECRGIDLLGEGGIIRDNIFKNVSSPGDLPNVDFISGNIAYCNPVSVGSNVSNGGIRAVPSPEQGWSYVIYDSNPTSGTFQTTLNTTPEAATAQPTSGTWVAGQFVRNSNRSFSSGQLILGWQRVTTGSGHVPGTDWLTIRVANNPADLGTAQTFAERMTFTKGSNSLSTTLADDAVVTLTIPATGCHIAVSTNNGAQRYFGYVRPGGFVDISIGATVDTTTGVLTGTTGVDGRLTLSIDTTTFYVENRLGSSRPITVSIIG